jgi:hypothetical protein
LEYVHKKLAAHGNDVEKTADVIGVTPAYIRRLLDKETE